MGANAVDIAEQAIIKLEAEENGEIEDDKDIKTDDKSTDKKGEDAKSTDEKSDKGSGQDSKEPVAKDKGETEPKDKDEKADKKEEEAEFTAEDALETEEEEQKPEAPSDNNGVSLNQSEQKYIVEHIGDPLIVRGIVGEGENAKEIEIKAYTANDIPANFHFTSDQARLAAQTGFTRLEQKAEQLLGNYRQLQNQEAVQDFERRRLTGIQTDVGDLQKEGVFPKFKVQPGQPGFDDDAAAKQMVEVIQLMDETNQKYSQQYQQGRPYRQIGFREAYREWELNNPGKQEEKAKDKAQDKEDADRQKTSERFKSNQGASNTKVVKPTISSGTTIDQILARHEMEL